MGNLAHFMHKIALFINSRVLKPELSPLPPHFNHCSRVSLPTLHMDGADDRCRCRSSWLWATWIVAYNALDDGQSVGLGGPTYVIVY